MDLFANSFNSIIYFGTFLPLLIKQGFTDQLCKPPQKSYNNDQKMSLTVLLCTDTDSMMDARNAVQVRTINCISLECPNTVAHPKCNL